MGAVVQYQPQQQAPVAATFTMSEMERIALAIAKGRLFGSDDPNAVLTLCMVAQAEGKHPGLVMQQYHIIKGKPAKKAEAMLVDFLAAGGRVVWNKLDDECADATFSHPQGGEVTINWTMARATKAGLMNNDTWKKYPRQMLRSRVVSEGVRTVFPGATSGMYVPEEVEAFDEPARPATPPTPQPQRARDLTPEPNEDGRAKAEKWVAEFTGKIAAADDDSKRAMFSKSANALAKLEREHPDLHEQAMGLAPVEGNPPQEAADRLIAAFKSAPTIVDLQRIHKDSELDRAAMPDDISAAVESAYEAECKRVKEGVA